MKAKLGNPTRMSLKDIAAYWNHWVSKDKKGDPFSFSLDDIDDNSDSNKGNDDSGGKKTPAASSDLHDIDDGIPLPLLCTTPTTRTRCLQKMVSNKDEISKTFHLLVEMVDKFEVSLVLSI